MDGVGEGGKSIGEGANIDELRERVEVVEIVVGVLDVGVGGVKERTDETGVGSGTLGGSVYVSVDGTVIVEGLVVGTVTEAVVEI